MQKTKHQNTTNYVNINTSSNGWTLLSTLIKYLCALSLIVLIGYIYLNLNKMNRDLQIKLTKIDKQQEDINLIKQNIDNILLQKAIEIKDKTDLNYLGLEEVKETHIIVLDAPDYDNSRFYGKKDKQKTAQY